MHDFTTFSDIDLVVWLRQYSGRQAGYYPDARRSRAAAEREARTRHLAWWRDDLDPRQCHMEYESAE